MSVRQRVSAAGQLLFAGQTQVFKLATDVPAAAMNAEVSGVVERVTQILLLLVKQSGYRLLYRVVIVVTNLGLAIFQCPFAGSALGKNR